MEEQAIKVNGKLIKGLGVAYDECHKIYIIEDAKDREEAEKLGYGVYNMAALPVIWAESCTLRFIQNWKLNKVYVGQEESATFDQVTLAEEA